jgi:hypothetical protein
MDITVKVKYGCSKSLFEPFGDKRYLVYLLSQEGAHDAHDELVGLISKKLGVPHNRIELRRDGGAIKVFQLS